MEEDKNPDFYDKRPYFVKGDFMLRWWSELSKEEQEALEFVVTPNPLMDAKRKVINHLERYGIISYQMARDMKLIPSEMTYQRFGVLLRHDWNPLGRITTVCNTTTRSDCNRRYYLYARDMQDAIYNTIQGSIRDE